MDIAIVLILLFAALLGLFGMLALLIKEGRQRKKATKAMDEVSCTVTQITVNCDADGNVTVVTNDPTKVRVEHRSNL